MTDRWPGVSGSSRRETRDDTPSGDDLGQVVDAVAEKSFRDILAVLREEIGEDRHDMWFGSVRLLGLRRGTMTVGVPNLFYRDWIASHYRTAMVHAAESVLGITPRMDLRVDPELYNAQRQKIDRAVLDGLETPQPDRADLNIDRFRVVSENTLAAGAVRHLLEGRPTRFQPMVVVGAPGTGKTHLLHAFDAMGGVLQTSALDITSRFTTSLKLRRVAEFRAAFDQYDVVCIDEFHRLRNKHATQVEVHQLLTRLMAADVQVVIASRHHPREIHDLAPNLVSILLSGMFVAIEPYGVSSLVEIASTSKGPRVGPGVMEALAHGCSGSVTTLRSRVLRVIAYAGLLGEPVTVDFVERHFDELVGPGSREREYDAVIDSVCSECGVSREGLMSKRKTKSLTTPRGVVAVVLRDRFRLTFKEIGRVLGGRSHTSTHAMYAKYRDVIADDPRLRALVARLPRSQCS